MASGPNFDEFAFEPTHSLETVEAVRAARFVTYHGTGEDLGHVEQSLPAYVTRPNISSTGAIIRFTPWSDDMGRPENQYIDSFLSLATGMNVVSVSAPGVDYKRWAAPGYAERTALSPEQRDDLKKGSFRRVGRATMRVALAALAQDLPEVRKKVMQTSSMGSAIGAAALSSAMRLGVDLHGAGFSEVVNTSPASRLQLFQDFMKANSDAKQYVAQNPEPLNIVEPDLKYVRRVASSLGANWDYFGAMGRAGFMADLGDLNVLREAGTTVGLRRGGEGFGSKADFDMMHGTLRANGVRVIASELPGHKHPYTMTIRSMVDEALALAA